MGTELEQIQSFKLNLGNVIFISKNDLQFELFSKMYQLEKVILDMQFLI